MIKVIFRLAVMLRLRFFFWWKSLMMMMMILLTFIFTTTTITIILHKNDVTDCGKKEFIYHWFVCVSWKLNSSDISFKVCSMHFSKKNHQRCRCRWQLHIQPNILASKSNQGLSVFLFQFFSVNVMWLFFKWIT